MNKQTNCVWFISDVSIYTREITDKIKQIIFENNLDSSNLKPAIEYCLTVSVSEVFSLPVVYKKNLYLENYFYHKLKTLSDYLVFNLIDRNYLNLFLNDEIKLEFTGNSLFLTTFTKPINVSSHVTNQR